MNISLDSFEKGTYVPRTKLNKSHHKSTGLYSLRLKKGSKLPSRYQKELDKRLTNIIYIGKAEKQSLEKRLGQELLHTSPGTFFRSIGAVLGYRPIAGSLKDALNKKNYKFSASDTLTIIKWLDSNIEILVIPYTGDFSIENRIIAHYSPILNHTHNPNKCAELIADREKCRTIARG